jgi:hypothetical protein
MMLPSNALPKVTEALKLWLLSGEDPEYALGPTSHHQRWVNLQLLKGQQSKELNWLANHRFLDDTFIIHSKIKILLNSIMQSVSGNVSKYLRTWKLGDYPEGATI